MSPRKKPAEKKPEEKRGQVVGRFLPLRDDVFHPLTHDEVRQMIERLEPDIKQVSDPHWRPTDGQIYASMKKHAAEGHDEIDAAVRDRLNVKPGERLGPGNVTAYKRLYEAEMEKRRKKRP